MGDGSLLYPAKKFGSTEPISTLRLESIREGQEDYEYLWMIKNAILQTITADPAAGIAALEKLS